MSRDRFEAIASKVFPGREVNAGLAAGLLRREHAAITRAVKRLKRDAMRLQIEQGPRVSDFWACRIAGLNDVLALLAARKGEK